ncbi:MAG: winged helix-turn-helix transcriptional regulator [Kiritimatiellae bacterium]|nr:winged helix-turn-helix transcriptional regulator [Kiritimatiellia bacterium]
MEEEHWSNLFQALGHPVRLRILTGLLKDECNVSAIQQALRIPQSTLSQHLRILKDRHILQARQEGKKRCYRVVDERIRRILDILREKIDP